MVSVLFLNSEVVELNSSKSGFILLDCCVCIVITMTIVLLIHSVKALEIKNDQSWQNDLESREARLMGIYRRRKRCEIECVEEEPSQSNF